MISKEQAWLDNTVSDIFGFRAAQLGVLPINGLAESRIPHTCIVGSGVHDLATNTPVNGGEMALPTTAMVADFEDLPFESQSLDLLILPHVLEFAHDPHQVLREVERVLMPEGRVIITGFNPLSLWGLKHAIFRRWWPAWPSGCKAIHIKRLKDLLQLLSIEAETGRFACYKFPATSEKSFSRFEFMEKAGDRWWPFCGAIYSICAVKRVRGMRLVGPAFKQKASSMKQLKPVARQGARKTSKL